MFNLAADFVMLLCFAAYVMIAVILLFLAIYKVVGYVRFFLFVVVGFGAWFGITASPAPGVLAVPLLLVLPVPFFLGMKKRDAL